MRSVKKLYFFICLSFICLVTACDQMDLDGPTGEFMLVNMSTALEDPLTFNFNGLQANTSPIAYGANSGYLSIKNGSYDFDILDIEGTSIYHQDQLQIGSGEFYTYLIFGQQEWKHVLLEDHFPSLDMPQIRFFNLVEEYPKLSLVSVSESDIKPIFEDRPLESIQSLKSNSTFEVQEGGTYSMTLLEEMPEQTGWSELPEDPEQGELPEDPELPVDPIDYGFLMDPVQINFESKAFYTIIATGQPGSAEYPLKLIVIKK